MLIADWSSQPCPIIGMLHAPPLPGSPDFQQDFSAIKKAVLYDAEMLVSGGVHGLMLENYGDTPFYPNRVPAITVAAMTSLACEIKRQFSIPLGINVLRNDGMSAMAIAVASGASFIRVNVLCGARVADQGVLQAIAHDLLRERSNLGAKQIQIWADVDVKHSSPLAASLLHDDVHDVIDRGRADAVIVTGPATGQPTDMATLQTVKSVAQSIPVIVGSGVTADSVEQILPFANAMIVGSSLKRDGNASNPVDIDRVRQLVAASNAASRYNRSNC